MAAAVEVDQEWRGLSPRQLDSLQEDLEQRRGQTYPRLQEEAPGTLGGLETGPVGMTAEEIHVLAASKEGPLCELVA